MWFDGDILRSRKQKAKIMIHSFCEEAGFYSYYIIEGDHKTEEGKTYECVPMTTEAIKNQGTIEDGGYMWVEFDLDPT